MMALVAFCPLTYVRTAWLAIQQDAPNIPRVDELIDYFTATWINGNFPPIHWNYFNQNQVSFFYSGVELIFQKVDLTKDDLMLDFMKSSYKN